MEFINDKYYAGFEGEPEIRFIYKKNNDTYIIIIWEGYFDEIMKMIVPEEKGWTGLAYYYNMYLAWYEESPWVIDNLLIALRQFKTINCKILSDESRDILKLICNMFKDAIDNRLDVCISRE